MRSLAPVAKVIIYNSKGRRRHDYTEFDWANTKLAKYREQKVKVKYECFAYEGIETDR